ncbi:MAG: Gfo/Idh/MocA family oxidoreductase [Verrucomicrobiae bacterium]|nr:Gfo/Idh/MocA family oxidoreductase [Verrucomicrobiae bacterium]
MKKIGFIDYYIDEWHANNYPQWIRNSARKAEYDVALAWEEKPLEGKRDLAQWCGEFSVKPAKSIGEVVEQCDAIFVLAPGWPEFHERLADLPLQSGKPVYLDKPFTTTLAAAQRLFEKADRHHTPLMSCSALRYGSALEQALAALKNEKIHFAAARGSGVIRGFLNYGIHQIEMLVMALGTGAQSVMQCGNQRSTVMIVDYADGRRGVMNLTANQPFQLTIQHGEDKGVAINSMDDFFPRMIDDILKFFATGVSPIPREETLECIAIFEAGLAALNHPDSWVAVPQTKQNPNRPLSA